MVYEGHTITQAAEVAGMTYESVRVALQRPHVQAALTSLKRERLGLESLRSFHKVAELRDGAASEKVQLDASKVIMTAAGDLEPQRQHAPPVPLAIQIITSPHYAPLPELVSSSGVIEARPYDPTSFRAPRVEAPESADDDEG
jgi:hypothetical protein